MKKYYYLSLYLYLLREAAESVDLISTHFFLVLLKYCVGIKSYFHGSISSIVVLKIGVGLLKNFLRWSVFLANSKGFFFINNLQSFQLNKTIGDGE